MKSVMNDMIKSKIEEAGRRAIENRRKGFHCSESTFLAINDTLKITDPSMVKLVTGFHGGGGTHLRVPGVNMNEVLEGLASGRDRRPPEEVEVEQVGHLCGALAAGILCIGMIYGRTSPEDQLTCPDELAFELHRRFSEEFGEKECRPLRQKWVPVSDNHTCERVYKRGAELAVELILRAHEIIPDCEAYKLSEQGNKNEQE
jgi:C_GCAxxG_C_C family probable redox protein